MIAGDPRAIGGVLLAGGRSTRFGVEKAVARFRGAAMMDAVAARFAGLGGVAISAAPGSAAAARAPELGAALLHDDPALPAGPLRGVLAGLEWAKAAGFEGIATAPCDAPLLPHDLFARLLRAGAGARAAFAITAEGEHPLCAVWSLEAHAPLRQALAAGEHPSVRRLLAQLGAVPLGFVAAGAFANANTPAALAALAPAP